MISRAAIIAVFLPTIALLTLPLHSFISQKPLTLLIMTVFVASFLHEFGFAPCASELMHSYLFRRTLSFSINDPSSRSFLSKTLISSHQVYLSALFQGTIHPFDTPLKICYYLLCRYLYFSNCSNVKKKNFPTRVIYS